MEENAFYIFPGTKISTTKFTGTNFILFVFLWY